MAKEQADSAVRPPPPFLVNGRNKPQGMAENLIEQHAFWIERVVTLLVLCYRVPPGVGDSFLILVAFLLIFTNSLYLIAFISSRPLLPMMAKDRNDANAIQVAVLGTAILVIAIGVGIIETLRYESVMWGMISLIAFWVALYVAGESLQAKYRRNKIIDEENTGQQEAKLDFSSKESKEELQAKDEMNNKTDEEFTGQLKAKLDVVHGWEEERSHLMYELGAARASLEIYRELLHDLHRNHQP
ncbi:hypothetical protein RHSIM_RhsimUnG0229900 [Rhododendron simsii]|uniref:Uncharacterized protein n=1 Tax=Rhododendron simsii TaxID=118357 RepID=A0A834FVE2_RHOSS|nr:hypothetical protein RHSIM_RhsimUnG0229900 [Rhododendron simsii]